MTYDEWGGFFDHVAPPHFSRRPGEHRRRRRFQPDRVPRPDSCRVALRPPGLRGPPARTSTRRSCAFSSGGSSARRPRARADPTDSWFLTSAGPQRQQPRSQPARAAGARTTSASTQHRGARRRARLRRRKRGGWRPATPAAETQREHAGGAPIRGSSNGSARRSWPESGRPSVAAVRTARRSRPAGPSISSSAAVISVGAVVDRPRPTHVAHVERVDDLLTERHRPRLVDVETEAGEACGRCGTARRASSGERTSTHRRGGGAPRWTSTTDRAVAPRCDAHGPVPMRAFVHPGIEIDRRRAAPRRARRAASPSPDHDRRSAGSVKVSTATPSSVGRRRRAPHALASQCEQPHDDGEQSGPVGRDHDDARAVDLDEQISRGTSRPSSPSRDRMVDGSPAPGLAAQHCIDPADEVVDQTLPSSSLQTACRRSRANRPSSAPRAAPSTCRSPTALATALDRDRIAQVTARRDRRERAGARGPGCEHGDVVRREPEARARSARPARRRHRCGRPG